MGVLKTQYLVPPTTSIHVNHGLILSQRSIYLPRSLMTLMLALYIGQANYEATVKCHFLKGPSGAVPKRKWKLLTKVLQKRGKRTDSHYILYKKGNCMGRAT